MQLLELVIISSGINRLSRFLLSRLRGITTSASVLSSLTKRRLQGGHFIEGVSWFLSHKFVTIENTIYPQNQYYMNISVHNPLDVFLEELQLVVR
jgi:hypothetical protein